MWTTFHIIDVYTKAGINGSQDTIMDIWRGHQKVHGEHVLWKHYWLQKTSASSINCLLLYCPYFWSVFTHTDLMKRDEQEQEMTPNSNIHIKKCVQIVVKTGWPILALDITLPMKITDYRCQRFVWSLLPCTISHSCPCPELGQGEDILTTCTVKQPEHPWVVAAFLLFMWSKSMEGYFCTLHQILLSKSYILRRISTTVFHFTKTV